ncbi:MAG TPA: hypothetical protein VF789_28875 [Thermoanaerobaculia bacterium]
MIKTLCLALALGTLFAAGPVHARATETSSASASTQAAYVRAHTIQEVISRWRPETHLYVLGDVGLEEDALRELAGWIGDRHWTVLLVQDATGLTYTDAEGTPRAGEDAIEYGTGQGIPRQAGFSAQVHPRTGQPDGAIFTIVLAQRALFYTGSEAQDSRGLGEYSFRGDLDQWAIAALRSGGDIAGAVRNTIAGIDGRLEQALRQEIDANKAPIVEATSALVLLEARVTALHVEYPGAPGPLPQTDTEALRRELAAAEALLAGSPEEAVRKAEEIRTRAGEQAEQIQMYLYAGEELRTAEADLARLERRPGAEAARPELESARRSLDAMRRPHARGDVPDLRTLGTVKAAVYTAQRRISYAETAANVRRVLGRFLLFLLAGMLVVAGFKLNHRRRGAKREARELLDAWRTALDKKLEALLDELERRVARFVGPASGEGRRPWEGETLRLAEAIRADVGSLYILWTSASGVLQQAEALIRARGLGAVYNFFLPGKYRRGIALLKDEPVPFDPADGLPRLFGHERTWRDDLLGDLASYQPFRKTFQEIVNELNLRAARAAEGLGVVESSVTDGPSELDETGERIRATAALQDRLQIDSFPDSLFLVPALFAAALPAAEAVLDRARELFPADPVRALGSDGAMARRIATEAAQLAGWIAGARRGALPAVEAGLGALREATVGAGWIEEERRRLSGRADLLASQAAERTIAPGLEELAQGLADLGERVGRAVALSRTLRETARPEIHRVATVVQSARGELGRALGLPPDRILREEGADPSERLESAARQADAAHESLGRGELTAASAALAEAARLTAEAEAIVEATGQAFADHATTVEERRAETARVEGLLPHHERLLARIREAFAPSVLALRADDPAHPDANATLADNLEEVRAHLGLAHEKLGRAVAAFPAGKLLASADFLRQVKTHQESAVHRLEEVAERQARLEKTVESNRALLETLQGRVREDQVSIAGDPRIMRPTVAAFEEGVRQLERARRSVEAVPGDPLTAEEKLLTAKAILDDVHDRMAPADRALHAEARKSVEAAARQLAAAASLTRRAAGDGIPDSPETTQAVSALDSLSAAHGRVQEALEVPHGDWRTLDAEADRIAAGAAHSAAALTGELAAAEAATAAISSASNWVHDATSWRGDYGVTISGNPGADALSEARSHLEQGRYGEAERLAGRAERIAADAVADAEATVRLRRAEEERREREERERREREEEESRRQAFAASSSSSSDDWSSGSDSSSGSGSSGWSDSGSGSASSSWDSSDSGSGKSGW